MGKYIRKGILGIKTFTVAPARTGDYEAVEWVKLSDEQIEFSEKNPNASHSEILKMQMNVAIEPVFDYGTWISMCIREKYSIDDEIAILRQREEKPTEFQEYYEYCESCKLRVKQRNSENNVV
ncbi:MAG: hypothetical protein LBG80_19080 [Bacteroidales bacterium]|jgi:hypothetical protein|nr:hypothetical protein [Bacteroidales bacterium]